MHIPPSMQLAMASVVLLLSSLASIAKDAHPNILLIAVDDLRPELGCYGATHILSPNMDAFAASGRRFERAYCQQAVCNPSRTSLMTGLRPDTIGVTGNHSHFRSNMPEVVTLPQYFKQQGYHTSAIGKLYHGVFPEGASNTKWDTMGDPESWSEPAVRFGPRYYYTEEGISAAKEIFQQIYKPKNRTPGDWTKKLVFGPATEAPDVPDNVLYDGQVADAAVQKLQQLKLQDAPFFLAVGFIKPHSPYVAPKKYFDLYHNVALTSHNTFPTNTPKFAGHGSGELRRYTDQPKRDAIPTANQLRVRQAYYACVSYIDTQIGRVLKQLELSGLSENTIVVLFGDHGYHLGEHGLWGKTTNFELDTRVPLIVRTPGMNFAGYSSSSLVELVDLYPTLIEVAGLPAKGLPARQRLEGKSFAKILSDPSHATKQEALSQYPRGADLMGYSLRTPTYRLTQWLHRDTGELRATELYDYADGLIEKTNIAESSPRIVEQLANRLAAYTPKQQAKAPVLTNPSGPDSRTSTTTSFEGNPAGPFDKLKTPIGNWIPTTGATIVDGKHAKAGKHCLQLTGGEKTSVTLNLASQADTSGHLTFWAERWTKRKPFTFRVEKKSGDRWEEIFNGDEQIVVGRAFLSHVTVPLADSSIKQLRFTVMSPPNTGVLIDDIRLVPATPQRIVDVEAIPFTVPALVGANASPLLKLKITASGSLEPISLTGLSVSLLGKEGDIESAQVYFGGANSQFATSTVTEFGKPIDVLAASESPITVTGKQTISDGENYVWIACKLGNEANIDNFVGAACLGATFSNGKSVVFANKSTQRIGVAVRKRGDEGVDTFRIPGLATTNQGTLIGVYDVRRRSGGDLPGDIDVGLSRSTDGGQSWEPMKIIMNMGDDPTWRYDGIGDPAVLVDQNTGTIWVAATWSHGDRSWRGSGPGLKPEETGQLMLVRSDDDGVTWSQPINITKQIKKPEWCFLLQGPGKGITMRDGTLVFAAQYQDPPNTTDKVAHRLPHSTIIYSKDHGKIWNIGTGAFDDTTESQVVEVEPGVLMLNCRYNRKSVRVVMTTRDMGQTWQEHTTSRRSLIEPGSCMASLIDVDREVGKDVGKWLLFSNPDSTSARSRITIKASQDRGLTWPKQHRLLLDEDRGAGYSCMSMIDDKTVGILYEGSQAHMTFQRIPLNDLIGRQEPTGEKGAFARPKPNALRQSLKLPRVFGSHMVLQAEAEIPVGGRAKPGATVNVPLGKNTQSAIAGEKGQWSVRLSEQKANSVPSTLMIESADDASSKGRPNILFIVSEDNSEHLGCYGERRVHTPHLDALAKGGIRYTRAYVPYSVCSPSRAAFLTGLYTRQTGHIGLATHRFSMYRDFKTIPRYFQQAGYYTGFLGKTHVNPERVVEDYIDHRAIRNSNFAKTTSIRKYAEEAGLVMRKAAEKKKPFLLIINYADAHRSFVRKSKNGFPTRMVDADIAPFPWIGSDSAHLREELRNYFNCMNRLDEGVGMVLDELSKAGARDNTLIVYISDHGADFPRGKGSIYENGTRIPMLINFPKRFPQGKVEDSMVTTIDILPTMLQTAGLHVPEHLPGIALQDIETGKVPPRKYIHTFTTGSSPNLLYMQFGIRGQRYKLVYNPDRTLNRLGVSRYKNSKLPEDQQVQSFLYPPEYELFDLQEDPFEWKNLAGSEEHQLIQQRLLEAMREFQREIKDPFAQKHNVTTFINEQKEYSQKPYKKAGFRWPHLKMFEESQRATPSETLETDTPHANKRTQP